MKKILLLFIIPFICLTQNNYCGERPIKPLQLENQTKKEYKESEVYINYKQDLKIWKTCMSPLAISNRDEDNLNKQKMEATVEKFKEKISNPCGDKPEKPVKKKRQKHDDYIKTELYIEYKKVLKEWKNCMSPQGISKRNEATMDKDFEVILTEIKKICGEKPEKPLRKKGVNHDEYKQTQSYIEYKQNLKVWNNCSSLTKKRFSWGDCGDKPEKPFREEGLNHEEYKQKPSYIEYKHKLNNWRECIDNQKK
ncbi:MAG: hypothetical protein CMP56_03865 [Flavobacteriales bacterium]|nr:hypothetical protein [Flavobacteriales bacterium]|tara:strand:+ start:1136 stop:1891 length:756 start_codon:yes stop_codon:yes gene_type:complete